MDRIEHEYFIDWIISNCIYFDSKGKTYSIRSPSKEAKFISQEIFLEFYYKAIENNVMDSDEMNQFLAKRGIWNDAKENLMKQIQEEIEEIKVNIFESYLQSNNISSLKKAIADSRNYLERLIDDKYSMDMYTAEGLARCAKKQFLLGCSIYNNNGRRLWKNKKYWDAPENILFSASQQLVKFNLTESNYRELARCDYWKNIWALRKLGGLFGRAVELSDPQKSLLSWSLLYDNVYKSSDCPSDDIINDDDALDGWLIKQRRKREAELNKSTINQLSGNEKIKNSEHVFILADEKNINKVYEMNDIQGKISLQKRLKQIKRDGCVSEANLIDTREHIQRKLMEMKK